MRLIITRLLDIHVIAVNIIVGKKDLGLIFWISHLLIFLILVLI